MNNDVLQEMCSLFKSGSHSIPDLMKKYGFGRNKITRFLKEGLGDNYTECAKRICAERGKTGSAKRKGRKNPHAPEWNRKISESQKGRTQSEETKKKISESAKTRMERGTLTPEMIAESRRKAVETARANGFYERHSKEHSEWMLKNCPVRGKKMSPEAKEKMKESKKIYYENGGVNNRKGKNLTQETRDKISNATSRMWKDGKFGYGNNGIWRSKLENSVFEELKKFYPQTVHSHPVSSERTYVYDVYIPELNLLIEVNGDYWHLNPSLYESCFFDTSRNILASDLWREDEKKLNTAVECGYKTAVIWEKEIREVGVEQSVRNVIDLFNPG